MNKRTKKILLLLFLACLAWGLTIGLIRFIDEHHAATTAAQISQQAASAASSTFTPSDARRWLEDHQFQVLIWNPHVSDGFTSRESEDHIDSTGPKLTHLIVLGQKIYRSASWPLEENWLNLTFQFTPEGKYQAAICEPSKLKLPTTSNQN